MKKILLVASVASHIAQFHRPLVDMLHQYGFEIHAAAHNNMELKPGLKLDFIDKFIEVPFVRSVKDPKNVAAYKTIKRVIYPLALNLFEEEKDVDAAAVQFVRFCEEKVGKTVDHNWIEAEYADCTPRYIAQKVIESLE